MTRRIYAIEFEKIESKNDDDGVLEYFGIDLLYCTGVYLYTTDSKKRS